MFRSRIFPGLLLSSALALGGCASDGSSLLTTGSLAATDTKVANSERISPECMQLMSTIQELRKEGTPERVEKISTGKSSTVSIKRTALAKLTELDKANAEFQMKCSKLAPPAEAAAAPAPAPAPAQTAAADPQQPAAAQ